MKSYVKTVMLQKDECECAAYYHIHLDPAKCYIQVFSCEKHRPTSFTESQILLWEATEALNERLELIKLSN